MHFDAHVHSAASPDSEMDPVRAINILKSKGLGVVFTEHVDFVTPEIGQDFSATDAPKSDRSFVCDFDIYPSQYKQLRSDSTLLGLEFGLTAAFLPLNLKTADNDYDFILGSIHFVDGHDVFKVSASMDAETFCRRYLTYGTEMVELCGFFDSLGHIDYIARYCEKCAKWFQYKNYPKEFDALLRALAERDIALEINTSRLGNDNVAGQLLPIYKRYFELGGRYVTLGSDAHNEWGLGRHYKRGLGLAKMAGLTPVYYKERERMISYA